MSIESHAWDREAFTLTSTDTEWIVKRRAFPPQLDPAQDRTNLEKNKYYFSSLVHLFDRRPPMKWCAGVNGFFVHQNVTAILLTDSIFARGLAFKNIVASFAWIHRSSGQELVARSAYLYDGKIAKVACAEGIFVKMEIDMLIMAAAVVLHDCTVRQIVINPQLQSGPIRSLTTFEEKFLCHDVFWNAPTTGFPKIILSGSSQKPIADVPIILRGNHTDHNWVNRHEELMLSWFERWMQDNRKRPINCHVDRGVFWGFALFDPSRSDNTSAECPICYEPLSSKDKVFGHFAPTATKKHILHCYCVRCFNLQRKESAPDLKTLDCSLCRVPFRKLALPTTARVESYPESKYNLLMQSDLQWARST